MANDDLKKGILEGVAQLLEPIHGKLDEHSHILQEHSGRLAALEEMKETVESNHGSLLRIEQTLTAYGEMYQVNKEKNEQLDQRVTKIEKRLDLPSAA